MKEENCSMYIVVDDKRGNFINNNPKMVNLQLLFLPLILYINRFLNYFFLSN